MKIFPSKVSQAIKEIAAGAHKEIQNRESCLAHGQQIFRRICYVKPVSHNLGGDLHLEGSEMSRTLH